MIRKPPWIRTGFPDLAAYGRTAAVIKENNINTVCRSALCPNTGECFSRGHLTFMILGDVCTRRCGFCSVGFGRPAGIDEGETGRIVKAAGILGISYAVITSVTRDDLPDGGAGAFADTVTALKEAYPGIKVDILTPDFYGRAHKKILEAAPYMWGHNIETVPRLYGSVRPQAVYERSISLLRDIKRRGGGILTKSGIMLGLGETEEEVYSVFIDLFNAGVDMLTIGQYLRPDRRSVEVKRYVSPDGFLRFKEKAEEIGFGYVLSGPFVRSSYRRYER